MKKFLIMLCVAVMLVVGVSAAETVIYQNDFSDPYSLFDFNQYRATWEIRDGALYMTDNFNVKVSNPEDNYGHIVYQSPTPLTEYVIEVDLLNSQSSAGVLFNVQQAKVGNGNSDIVGYTFNMSKAADIFALGCGKATKGWSGNINTGNPTPTGIYKGANIHLTVIVKGGKIGLNAYNMDTQKRVYGYTYSIGANKLDSIFADGTFGFRVIQQYQGAINANTVHFDNLVVTTANETTVEDVVNKFKPAEVVATRIDTRNITPIYTNTFDSAEDIAEFEQYYGTWDVIDGKLYLTDVESAAHSMIIYNGKEELLNLTDFVVDVDMYNVQSQGGAIIRSDSKRITGNQGGSDFFGYLAYLSFDGTKGALGFSKVDGNWGNNFDVSQAVTKPGANVHIQVAVKGEVITYYLTDIDTGAILWSTTKASDMWTGAGTFGLRLNAKIYNETLDCVMNTAYDNLVVSLLPDDGASKKEIKMTVDSMTAYVNGTATTLDAAPVIKNDRTMLPVRFVAENLGATVGWDAATQTVTITGSATIEIVIGANTAKVNGAEIALDSPAYIDATNNRTYLPVRVVAENLGATVGWDAATRTATLTK